MACLTPIRASPMIAAEAGMSIRGPVAVDEIPHEESGDPSGDPPGGYTQPNWLRLIPMASPWESRTVRN
ncbi:MAG: hypothetical protein VX654_10480 [Chloroflexota bacterium]|nr:hypothetical protein [Chloroflexota bacterium]